MRARFLLPLALTCLPTAQWLALSEAPPLAPARAEAVHVVSLPVEQVVDRDSVVAVVRVKRRTTGVRDVENDHSDPRLLSGRLMEVSSRYEVEWVRFLVGKPQRRTGPLTCTERMDPLLSYSSTTTGLEHEVREGGEYIFFCRFPPGSGGAAEVFRVEPMEREEAIREAVKAVREDARTSENR